VAETSLAQEADENYLFACWGKSSAGSGTDKTIAVLYFYRNYVVMMDGQHLAWDIQAPS